MNDDQCPCLFGRSDECPLSDEELDHQLRKGTLRYQSTTIELLSIPIIVRFISRFNGFGRFERLRFKYFRKITKTNKAKHARWGARGEFFFSETVWQKIQLYL